MVDLKQRIYYKKEANTESWKETQLTVVDAVVKRDETNE